MAENTNFYAPSSIGCAFSASCFIGLIAGIYHGANDALGKPLEPGLEKLLMTAPSILGAVVGPGLTRRMLNDPNMVAKMPPIPEEVKGCATGCSGIANGIAIPAAANYIGYLIGGYIGNKLK